MPNIIGILGGTGAEGRGLAKRFVQAGHPVILGSRQAERAQSTADEINVELGSSLASGAENAEAARAAELVILALPYAGITEALRPFAASLAGKTLISAVVPLEFVAGSPRPLPVAEGSAAQELQAMLPNTQLIGAFHHVSAPTLSDLNRPIGADVLVCGDNPEARRSVVALAEELWGVRGIDAGPLECAGPIEAFTAVLLRINRRYKAHAGVLITDLPEPPAAAALTRSSQYSLRPLPGGEAAARVHIPPGGVAAAGAHIPPGGEAAARAHIPPGGEATARAHIPTNDP